MKEIKIFGKSVLSWGSSTQEKPPGIPITPTQDISFKSVDPKTVNLPARRISEPSQVTDYDFYPQQNTKILRPSFIFEVIPYIRKLVHCNPNISQALNNIVELGNTGHSIKFDASVTEDQINKMRAHLDGKKKEWSESVAGMDGLVNKMISQIMVSGALSNEWVPNMSLTGIKTVALVNPETIRWSYNKVNQTYEAYQHVKGILTRTEDLNLIKLNPNTFKYYALNGDTDEPYGIPPYLSALDPVATQRMMLDNIKFIVEQVGVLGFLEVTMEKPEQLPNESYEAYVARLNTFLDDARKRVQEGYRDGITVGFKDDTEFDFKATSRNFAGVNELFQLNEILLSSGVKTDPSMLGRSYSSSETQITVIFSKLISQLQNIQNLVKCNLEYGYSLELRLAGFKFNTLNVIFNSSTALDKLKDAQAEEILVRNNNALYLDGIIGQEQYAHNMGYEKPNQKKPRFIRGQVQTEAEAKQKMEAGKNKSDKKTRQKNKPL